MKIRLAAIAILSALMLSSCDYINANMPHFGDPVEDKFNFNYEIASTNMIKLSQVFDDKKSTYILFITKLDKKPSVTLPHSHHTLPVKKSGTYWIVDGVYPELHIWRGNKSVIVKNRSFVAPIETGDDPNVTKKRRAAEKKEIEDDPNIITPK